MAEDAEPPGLDPMIREAFGMGTKVLNELASALEQILAARGAAEEMYDQACDALLDRKDFEGLDRLEESSGYREYAAAARRLLAAATAIADRKPMRN